MKILQINAIYGRKSTGSIVQDIDRLARLNGMESWVAYPADFGKPLNGIPIGNRADRLFHALYTRFTGRQGFASWRATRVLIRKLHKIHPDVVHLHNLHSNFMNLNMLFDYLKEEDIPTVITLHDCWFFTGKCFHFADVNCVRWKSTCGNCPKKKLEIPSLFFDASEAVLGARRQLFSGLKHLVVVGCSNWITGLASQSPIWKGRRFATICNGVDPQIFTLDRRDSSHQGMFIMTMANKWFHPENRIVTEKIYNSLQPLDKIILVGCTAAQSQSISGKEKIYALSSIEKPEEMARQYANADLFLNLTLADTSPTVNMEACCCGTPVVTYDIGGSGELVSHGETGFIIPPKEVNGLLQSIEKIRSGAINRQRCREFGVTHFDRTRNFQGYLNLYKELISMGSH